MRHTNKRLRSGPGTPQADRISALAEGFGLVSNEVPRADGWVKSGHISNLGPRPIILGSTRPVLRADTRAPAKGSSKLEQMTIASQQFSQARTGVLGILLDAANPARCGGRPVLWPLWADEAMHRTYSFVSLTVRLDVRVPPSFGGAFVTQLEVGNAIALARSYRGLDIVRDLEVLPCADLSQSITHGLVALFGPTIGDIGVRTRPDQIHLQAFKRRALILACGELVVNALRHAFDGESKGQIDVTLAAIGSDRARLVVADDGC